jgi:hypothetical protein
MFSAHQHTASTGVSGSGKRQDGQNHPTVDSLRIIGRTTPCSVRLASSPPEKVGVVLEKMMKTEYKLALISNPSGFGLITRTPTEANIETELRRHTTHGWRLIQVLTLGLLYRRTWLVLVRDSAEAMSSDEMK